MINFSSTHINALSSDKICSEAESIKLGDNKILAFVSLMLYMYALPIKAYTWRLCPACVNLPFSGFKYTKGQGFH